MATTAVIANYNSAVELEFMSQWREALKSYEKAARLASIAMKEQNPMSQKIAQAIFKMRMKVRNKVQLPDKLILQAANVPVKGKRSNVRSQFANQSKITSQMQGSLQERLNRDWQTSINSTASANQDARAATVVQSNDFAQNSDLQPTMASFYPEESLLEAGLPASQVNSLDMPQAHMTSKQRKFRDPYEVSSLRKKTTTQQQIRQNDKSPLSLKKIIDKLERTERDEAK